MSMYTKRAGRFSMSVAALAVPTIFGVVAAGTPAYAATAGTTTGICNGVTNQLAHRGNAQPNLQAERAALVTTQNSLTAQITAAENEIAALDAQYAALVGQIDTATMSLTKLEADKATLTAAIAAANTELTTLKGQRTALVDQIT